MDSAHEIHDWSARLEAVIADRCTLIRRVIVINETDSTQDAARRLGLMPGEGVVAGMQTYGRGRHGRWWSGAQHAGVYLTLVLEAEYTPRPSIAGAVSAAHALETLFAYLPARSNPGINVGIKWPNDLVAPHFENRKLGGILIEQSGGSAYIGIGINVHAQAWAADLAGKAISLEELGINPTRIDVLAAIVGGVDEGWRMQESALVGAYCQRDILQGKHARFLNRSEQIEGIVEEIDPLRGLAIRTDLGIRWLDANVTTRLE